MTLLILQIIVTLLTAIISQIALNKDSRSRTGSLKKETLAIRWIIFFVSIVSIANSIVSYIDSESEKQQLVIDKKNLNANLSALRNDNTILRKTLDRNSVNQSNLTITSQKKSASDLKIAAKDLHELINGSDSIVNFHFVFISKVIGKEVIKGALLKNDLKPVYNLIITITNMDSLLACKTILVGNVKILDLGCLRKNQLNIGLVPVLNNNDDYDVDLPKYDSNGKKGKFLMTLSFKGKLYQQEAIYSIQNNELLQATRIIELKDDKVIRMWIVNKKEPQLKNVDWEKEFPKFYIHRMHMVNLN